MEENEVLTREGNSNYKALGFGRTGLLALVSLGLAISLKQKKKKKKEKKAEEENAE